MTQDIDQYAVFGNPVEHSKSPQIHALFAKQTDQNLHYVAKKIEAGQFSNAVRDFASNNGKGLNITIPFKQEAWQLASNRSARAERAGAVNTLKIDNGVYFGENTDGIGLVRDLVENHGINLTEQRVLIIGAGGAVRGVIEPILEQNPKELVIANRTVEKAQQLANDFSDISDLQKKFTGKISGCGLDDPVLNTTTFNIIINGTSASLHGELPVLPKTLISKNTCAYDMMYAASATPFMQWASENNAKQVLDGLGMLVEQAAESFKIWRGVRPETKSVIDTIRASL